MREETYYIGKMKIHITSNTPSPEAIADANEELNKMAFEKIGGTQK